jgi:putative endonuclease
MEAREREVVRQAPRWEDGAMDDGAGGKTWWVYMISCRGGKIYTGTAIDPEARYEAHRSGKGAAFTRANPPVLLLRSVAFESRPEACRAEAALKKMSREKKLSWARGDFS